MKIRERTKRDNEYATADSEPCGEFYWGVWVKDLFLQARLGADLVGYDEAWQISIALEFPASSAEAAWHTPLSSYT